MQKLSIELAIAENMRLACFLYLRFDFAFLVCRALLALEPHTIYLPGSSKATQKILKNAK
jgi:hypothetical protein